MRASIDLISLPDCRISRVQLVAVIRWRIFWERFGYYLLLWVSTIGAFAAIVGAIAAVIAVVKG
jgi:hypothetical protein